VERRTRLCGTLWQVRNFLFYVATIALAEAPGNATDCALRWSLNSCSRKIYGELIARRPGSFSAWLREFFSLHMRGTLKSARSPGKQSYFGFLLTMDQRVPYGEERPKH
jgi:hypothetical protein